MWENAVDFLLKNNFTLDKEEEIKWYNYLVFRHPDYNGLIIKVYEGRVYIGTCYDMTKSSFTSMIQYYNHKPVIIEPIAEIYRNKYPIIQQLIPIVCPIME